MHISLAKPDWPDTIAYQGDHFVIDTDLQEFRRLGNPLHVIHFESRDAEALCERAGVTFCDQCHSALRIRSSIPLSRVPCPYCHHPIRSID